MGDCWDRELGAARASCLDGGMGTRGLLGFGLRWWVMERGVKGLCLSPPSHPGPVGLSQGCGDILGPATESLSVTPRHCCSRSTLALSAFWEGDEPSPTAPSSQLTPRIQQNAATVPTAARHPHTAHPNHPRDETAQHTH